MYYVACSRKHILVNSNCIFAELSNVRVLCARHLVLAFLESFCLQLPNLLVRPPLTSSHDIT